MKRIRNLKGIVIAAAMAFSVTGCQMGLVSQNEQTETVTADRKVKTSEDIASEWEQFTDKEIADAKKACPVKQKGKVVAFEGACAKLFNLGANLIPMDEIEDDRLYELAGYGKTALNAGMKYLDGMLDLYTGGLYKTAIGALWPDEKKADPAMVKLQDSVDNIQKSVDTVIDDIGQLSEDMKAEFDSTKITERQAAISAISDRYAPLFTIMQKMDADTPMDYLTYYNLKVTAVDQFGSVENMLSETENFYTQFCADKLSTRDFGHTYRAMGEAMFPWRYQSNAFIQKMMVQELDLGTKMFSVCDMIANPGNETGSQYVLFKYIKDYYPGNNEIETAYVNAATFGTADLADIQALMEQAKSDAQSNADAQKSYERALASAESKWNSLVSDFDTYALTINKIEIPEETSNTHMTCNVRRVRYTFETNYNGTVYSNALSHLACSSDSAKTEENWKKIYRTGWNHDDESGLVDELLTAGQYQALLDFYTSNGIAPSAGKVEWTESDEGSGKWYMKKSEGEKLDVNLYNIFKYDADMIIYKHNADRTDIFENGETYPVFACCDGSNNLGFKVYDKHFGKLTFDGRNWWKVDAAYVEGDKSSVSQKYENVLGQMSSRSGDDNARLIRSTKYYNDSYVSKKYFTIVGIRSNNDAKFNK